MSGTPTLPAQHADALQKASVMLGLIRRSYGEPGSRDTDVARNNEAVNFARKAIFDALASGATQPSEPEFFTVFALYEGGGEKGWIALPGYSNETEHGVKNLVLEAARKEGYKGTVTGRLQELGWEVRPVYATPPTGEPLTAPRDKADFQIETYNKGWDDAIQAMNQVASIVEGNRAALAATAAPNMFWNDADPERGHDSIHEVLDAEFGDGTLLIGETRVIQQAVRLANVTVRVIADPDDEHGFDYEEVQPEPKP